MLLKSFFRHQQISGLIFGLLWALAQLEGAFHSETSSSRKFDWNAAFAPGSAWAQSDTDLSQLGIPSSAQAGEEKSESSREEKTPAVQVLEDSPEKTIILLTLDSSAIELLKKQSEADSSETDVLVLPLEDDAMETLWSQAVETWHSIWDYLKENRAHLCWFLIGFFGTWLGVRVLRWIFELIYVRLIEKSSIRSDDFIYGAILPPILGFFWILGLSASAFPLLEEAYYAQRIVLAALAGDFTWLVFRLIGAVDDIICLYFRGKKRVFNKLIFDAIRKTLRIALVLLAVCVIGQTILGLNVSALLAAAGIFGLAIAFAVKDTLSNFLSSFMMLFDNSFQLGDQIRTGAIEGYVESVDFRSTRIRALNGHLYSVPNAILGNSTIENVTQRPGIRYDFELGLAYQTTLEQMEEAVQIVRELISDPERYIQSPTRSLVTFGTFAPSSLNVKVMLWLNTSIYVEAEKWKHDLHMEILKRFREADLEFAYPTQRIYLNQGGKPFAEKSQDEDFPEKI